MTKDETTFTARGLRRAPEGFSEDPLLWFPKQQDEVCQSQADIQDTGKAEV